MLRQAWLSLSIGVGAACTGAVGQAPSEGLVLSDSGARVDASPLDASPHDAGLPTRDVLPFEGSYASAKPAQSAKAKHQAKGVTILSSNPRADCMGCHVPGGQASAKAFAFSGMVFVDAKGTTPAVDAEVWVMDGAGKKVKANSDDNGHVWLLASASAIDPPFVAGLRSSSAQSAMLGAVGQRGCNTTDCHGGVVPAIHTGL